MLGWMIIAVLATASAREDEALVLTQGTVCVGEACVTGDGGLLHQRRSPAWEADGWVWWTDPRLELPVRIDPADVALRLVAPIHLEVEDAVVDASAGHHLVGGRDVDGLHRWSSEGLCVRAAVPDDAIGRAGPRVPHEPPYGKGPRSLLAGTVLYTTAERRTPIGQVGCDLRPALGTSNVGPFGPGVWRAEPLDTLGDSTRVRVTEPGLVVEAWVATEEVAFRSPFTISWTSHDLRYDDVVGAPYVSSVDDTPYVRAGTWLLDAPDGRRVVKIGAPRPHDGRRARRAVGVSLPTSWGPLPLWAPRAARRPGSPTEAILTSPPDQRRPVRLDPRVPTPVGIEAPEVVAVAVDRVRWCPSGDHPDHGTLAITLTAHSTTTAPAHARVVRAGSDERGPWRGASVLWAHQPDPTEEMIVYSPLGSVDEGHHPPPWTCDDEACPWVPVDGTTTLHLLPKQPLPVPDVRDGRFQLGLTARLRTDPDDDLGVFTHVTTARRVSFQPEDGGCWVTGEAPASP